MELYRVLRNEEEVTHDGKVEHIIRFSRGSGPDRWEMTPSLAQLFGLSDDRYEFDTREEIEAFLTK